jgi:hypothetical protein
LQDGIGERQSCAQEENAAGKNLRKKSNTKNRKRKIAGKIQGRNPDDAETFPAIFLFRNHDATRVTRAMGRVLGSVLWNVRSEMVGSEGIEPRMPEGRAPRPALAPA